MLAELADGLEADAVDGYLAGQDRSWIIVEPKPRATGPTLDEIIGNHVDYRHQEAFFVVSTTFGVTADRTLRFGLQFFLAGDPVFSYAPDENLTPAEVVWHTLVLDSDSRRVSYAMLLIEKENRDQETLTKTATWYDLESTVAGMYRPLNGEFDASSDSPVVLPCEAEFTALNKQYGVS